MQNLLHTHAVVFFKALFLRPRQQTVGHHKRQLSKRMRNVTCALELYQTHHRAAFV